MSDERQMTIDELMVHCEERFRKRIEMFCTKECKYGNRCKNPACTYLHPHDDPEDIKASKKFLRQTLIFYSLECRIPLSLLQEEDEQQMIQLQLENRTLRESSKRQDKEKVDLSLENTFLKNQIEYITLQKEQLEEQLAEEKKKNSQKKLLACLAR